jgi:hypothetical protein
MKTPNAPPSNSPSQRERILSLSETKSLSSFEQRLRREEAEAMPLFAGGSA